MEENNMMVDHKTCFQFKASFSPCTILLLKTNDLALLETQLAQTIQKAPNIFLGTPVVIDLENLESNLSVDFESLKSLLIKLGLAPMGVRGVNTEQCELAAAHNLPLVTVGKNAKNLDTNGRVEPNNTEEKTTAYSKQEAEGPSNLSDIQSSDKTSVNLQSVSDEDTKNSNTFSDNAYALSNHANFTKIVTDPVRSGMQVYAKNSDLIVIGQVSAGAELLADGNIHVYGALRGRALAGLLGNTEARIFCRTLEAELVSIAGFYLTKEDMQSLPVFPGMIQIFLENEQVKIEGL